MVGKRKRDSPTPDASAPSTSIPVNAPAQTSRDQHFRKLYAQPPDFEALALVDREFAAVIKGREIDFNDAQSVVQLTKTLLKLDFGLSVDLPDDRLCPPVVNRHNYILWLKDLLDSTSYDPPGKLLGLDIGTGASCVYPLLGCTQRPWHFVATDIDAKNLEYAARNIEKNNLASRIQLLPRDVAAPLIPDIDGFDFCMTNPPFFPTEEAMLAGAAKKSRPPNSVCTGAAVEMVTEGGEVRFVERIIEESLVLKEGMRWYTAMLGFLSSVTSILAKLKEHDIGNFAVTEFVQGQTKRWAVAWSFRTMRPSAEASRIVKALPKDLLPPITEVGITTLPLSSLAGLGDHLSEAISALDLLSWEWDKQRLEGTGRATDRVWARAWRRMKERGMQGTSESDTSRLFGFTVEIRVKTEVHVACRWREGVDPVAFESFVGFLKRLLHERVPKDA